MWSNPENVIDLEGKIGCFGVLRLFFKILNQWLRRVTYSKEYFFDFANA